MYGAEWCPDCRRTKSFLRKNNIDFEYINIDITPEAYATGEKVIIRENESFQTVLINDTVYSNPQNYELAQTLGLTSRASL
jgi:thioredoxin reductase (NADPH)